MRVKVNFTSFLNEKSLLEKTQKAAVKEGFPKAYERVERMFNNAHRKMLAEFDRHNVTQEILKGPATSVANISKTLDGYGNLFSFIGFDAGTNPIAPLRYLLENGTTFKYTTLRYTQGAWYFRVTAPDKKAISNATPMPRQSGQSWVDEIESGPSNLTHYLFAKRGQKLRGSHSGTGLQAPWEINDDLVPKKTPYLSKILENFRNRIQNSRINDYNN